jgi:NRAMP (natural resistance-associated macrophage protein)-like metal ion transporter
LLNKIKKILKSLGPGFITGASDDDPSGIATYSQTGAKFGFNLLWTPIVTLPFMVTIQEMCGRIGIVTKKGLSQIIRENYSQKVLYVAVFLLLIANTVNIGADLGAMASAGQLILGIPFIFWLIGMTVLTLVLEIFVSYKVYSRFLKYLTFSLFAYIIAAFIVTSDWGNVFHSIINPKLSLNKEALLNIVALLGTTISPYLFFWQTNEEVEESVEKMQENHQKTLTIQNKDIPSDIKSMRLDTFFGMLFSNLVMFFIIVTTGATLFKSGINNIETANQAAEALRPLAGNLTFALFGLGIIGTGLLAVPVLAGSASYAVSEAFGWKSGLYQKFRQAHGFYGVITIATLIGLLVNFTSVQPFQMLYYTAVINGVCAPPLMIMIMLISNNKKVMGNHTNGKFSNWFGWFITIVMSVASIGLLISII